MQETLIARWEPARTPQGLASPCLHLELPGVWTSRVKALIGARRCEVLTAPDAAQAAVRVDPSLDLPLFAALLRAAGWRVDLSPPGLRAWPSSA